MKQKTFGSNFLFTEEIKPLEVSIFWLKTFSSVHRLTIPH